MMQVNNALYKTSIIIGANKIKQISWYFFNAIIFKSALFPINTLKVLLLKMFGAQLGEGIVIKPGVNIKFPWKLAIGNHSWIGEGVWIDNLATVTIGSSVCISQNAYLLTGNHNFKKQSFDLITTPIIIEDGVWIGASAIVCPGVICGSHAVLSVASVATKNMDPYHIYKGNPAEKVSLRVIE